MAGRRSRFLSDARARQPLVAVAILAVASCAGPQPLRLAINPVDEESYLTYVNQAGGDPAEGYAHWMANERGTTVAEVLREDQDLSTKHNPFDAHKDPQAVSRGAVIYKQLCARCHGDEANGKGPFSPPNHPATSFKTFGKRFAATIHRGAPRKWFRVISEGSGDVLEYKEGEPTSAMPAFGKELTREQIWLVITYLQSLDRHIPKDRSPESSS